MINARELRIGNLFFDEDKTHCYYAGSWQRNDGWIHRDSASNTYKEAGMYPIELTEDILIKCGIEKTGNVALNLWWRINDVYLLNKNDGSFEIVINDFSIGKIKFLHQLQNLYYELTGEELNIELNAPVSDTTKA